MDGTQSVMALAILTAIPVVMFAIWADYYGRYLEDLKKDEPRYERAPELQKIKLGGVYATVMQVLLYLGSGPIRENHWGLATLMFLSALTLQSQLQFKLEKKVRDQPKGQPGVAGPSLASGTRAMLWSVAGVMAYLITVQLCALGGAALAWVLGMSQGAALTLTLIGGGIGILGGLGLTFALAPVHVRKMFPTTRLEEAQALELLRSCFARAGVSAPEFWVVETESYRWNNAWIAGFRSGRGWFRPGLFLTRSLLEGCAPAELEAIVLHEVAHVQLNHLRRRFFYTIAMVGAALFGAFCVALVAILALPEAAHPLARITALTFAIAMPFIQVRKQVQRQEDEADRHAVVSLGARLDDFVRALRKVDQLNDQSKAALPMTEARITRVTIAYERHLAETAQPETLKRVA